MDADFPPTHTAALTHLAAFLPRAGRAYAAQRNHDLPGHPHVSRLSPYLRHRILTEAEVLSAVLARHSAASAEKFVQEVFWRTYWKGWLELRPSVWPQYRIGLTRALDRVATSESVRRGWEDACEGRTGLAPFDTWAAELRRTGYLHNHARMWFASIWCFTLGLPWELGADFFLRHLLDGDAASNTLSWRWVAGIQTRGKVYVARADNIARYTDGRFAGLRGLAQDPAPLPAPPDPLPGTLPASDLLPDAGEAPPALLLTEDELSPGWLLARGLRPRGTAVLLGTSARSPLAVSARVADFTRDAVQDCLDRHGDRLGVAGPVTESPQAVMDWLRRIGTTRLVLPHAPVGPAADRVALLLPLLAQAGIRTHRLLRPYDAAAWPHATYGFFRFKAAIPDLIAELGLARTG